MLRHHTSANFASETHLFCGDVGDKEELYKTATSELDQMSKNRDKVFLSKLYSTVMIAINHRMFLACLNCAVSQANQVIHAPVLFELVDYSEEHCGSGLSFSMAEVAHFY